MQVFVPEMSYAECAQYLDNKRLCKQALECIQIMDTLLGLPTKSGKARTGWFNHPAVLMWKGCEGELVSYTHAIIDEMDKRGFKTDTYLNYLNMYTLPEDSCRKPIWWGDGDIHESHKIRLAQKGWEQLYKYNKIDTLEWYNSKWDFEDCDDFFNREYLWATNSTGISYSRVTSVSKQALEVKRKLIEEFGLNPYAQTNKYHILKAVRSIFEFMFQPVNQGPKFHPESFDVRSFIENTPFITPPSEKLLNYAEELWIKWRKNSVYYNKRGGRFQMATEAPLITV